MKLTHVKILGSMALLMLLGACASQPSISTSTPPDPATLNEGGRKLTQWNAFFKEETNLERDCLLEAEPAQRVTGFNTCFAGPMTQSATSVGFPLMKDLETYLGKSRALATRAQSVGMSKADYRHEQAKLLDVFVVTINRYLADTTEYLGGGRVVLLTDPLIIELKKDEVTRLINNSNISALAGLIQVGAENNIRTLAVQKGIDPDRLVSKISLTAQDKSMISSVYTSQVISFYTYDDLRTLNGFYEQKGQVLARKDISAQFLSTQASQEIAKRKMFRAVSRGLMELGKEAPAGETK